VVPVARGLVARWLMIDTTASHSVRVRSYGEVVRDAGRTFRLSSDADVRAVQLPLRTIILFQRA